MSSLIYKAAHFLYNFLSTHGYPYTAHAVSTFLVEPGPTLRASLFFPMGWKKNFDYCGLNPTVLTANQAQKCAVVLFHGNFSNPSSLLALAKQLEEKGVSPIYTVNLPNGTVTEVDTQITKTLLSQIARQYGERGGEVKFILVGHSRGAEVATTVAEDDRVVQIFRLDNPLLENSLSPDATNRIYDVIAKNSIHSKGIGSTLSTERVHYIDSGHLGIVYHPETAEYLLRNFT